MEGSNIFLHFIIGPLMLVISLIFFYFPPKKINLIYGHRTTLSMKTKILGTRLIKEVYI